MKFKQFITTSITALLSSTIVFANTSENGSSYGVDVFTTNSTSGEYNVVDNIDLHTGQLSLEQIDISIPGNGGLDLNIGRSYQKETLKNYGVPHLLGNWALAIPKVEMNSGDLTTIQSGCAKPDPGVIATLKFAEKNGYSAFSDNKVAYDAHTQCDDAFSSVFRPDLSVSSSTPSVLRWMNKLQFPYQATTHYEKYLACNDNASVGYGSGRIVEPEYIDRSWLGVNVILPGESPITLKHSESTKAALYGGDKWISDNNVSAGCVPPKSGLGLQANNVKRTIGITKEVRAIVKSGVQHLKRLPVFDPLLA